MMIFQAFSDVDLALFDTLPVEELRWKSWVVQKQPQCQKGEAQPEMMMMRLLWGDLVEAEEQRLEPRTATGH